MVVTRWQVKVGDLWGFLVIMKEISAISPTFIKY